MSIVTIEVTGRPAPQGSKRHVGGGRMVEMSKSVGPWREAVRAECQRAGIETFTGPVHVRLIFRAERPQGHYRTGRNAHLLRDSAPRFPAGRPDIDKLARAVLDGLTAGGAWKDDSQVVRLYLYKTYGAPGCSIEIGDVDE